MRIKEKIIYLLGFGAAMYFFSSCSTTDCVPEGDQLFTGLNKIKYQNYEKNNHFHSMQEEVEAALATPPNGALFGSSYHRSPFQFRLWVWDKFSKDESPLGKWLTKSFGRAPVLMSWVNPQLRSSVAKEVLRMHGYFRGDVGYEVVKQDEEAKKAKISYVVRPGHLFTIDTIAYVNFPSSADSLIESTKSEALIRPDAPFDVETLDAERTRLATLFRNNGYYYYQPDYSSYLADTFSVPGKVQLRLQMADSIDEKALRQWYVGKINVNYRKRFMETLRDSLRRRNFMIRFNGKRPPIRTRVLFNSFKIRSNRPYSYEKHMESVSKMSSNGLFSMVDFVFTPRDSSANCDTLDLTVNCVFDKPYDFYIETNAVGKTNGKIGPQFVLGLAKRNFLKGGETFDFNIHGSYEWQTSGRGKSKGSRMNSYEYGADASLELPRLLLPFKLRRRFFTPPSTVLKVSTNTINRADFFKRHIVSGEMSYKFQKTSTTRHVFSPLILDYEYMIRTTSEFDKILVENPYLQVSMRDQFVPKLRYSFNYSSPPTYRNPIFWETTFSEASNILSLGYLVAGKKWNTKEKTMFKNPYAQFLKLETNFSKTWAIGEHSSLVGHVNAGVIYSYGNASQSPYTEQFYVGGANSIRAFTVRTIGPGRYYTDDSQLSYMDQTGDLKLLFNLEYRMRLFGSLHGAVFLDAGNVWTLKEDSYRPNSTLNLKRLHEDMGVGTGVGLRYNFDFFVIRLDWGIGLHVPYETGKNGFYNIRKFKDGQSIHLAIGYPF